LREIKKYDVGMASKGITFILFSGKEENLKGGGDTNIYTQAAWCFHRTTSFS
jgi:hypothetical protein